MFLYKLRSKEAMNLKLEIYKKDISRQAVIKKVALNASVIKDSEDEFSP